MLSPARAEPGMPPRNAVPILRAPTRRSQPGNGGRACSTFEDSKLVVAVVVLLAVGVCIFLTTDGDDNRQPHSAAADLEWMRDSKVRARLLMKPDGSILSPHKKGPIGFFDREGMNRVMGYRGRAVVKIVSSTLHQQPSVSASLYLKPHSYRRLSP